MSKLAIILCAALFASAANGSFFSDQLDKAQEALETLIDVTIAQVRQVIADARQKSDEVIKKIEVQAAEYREKLANDLSAEVQKGMKEVNELTNEVDDVDVSECVKLGSNLQFIADAALLQMEKCFTDKSITAAGYVENMLDASEEVIANLEVYKEEAHACIDKANGIISGVKAVACTNLVAAKAALSTTKAIPSITVQTVKLTFLLNTLLPTLTYCTTTKAIETFYENSKIISKSTKKCIEEQTEAARKAVSEE